MPEVMGAGVALFDYDNDGDLDVFLVQGGPLDADAGPRRRRRRRSRLFRNDLAAGTDGGRTLRFTDVTERARRRPARPTAWAPPSATTTTTATSICSSPRSGPTRSSATTATARSPTSPTGAGVSDPRWSTSAAFLDYDRDGGLDLFVANYVDFTIAGNKQCCDSVGARDYCSPRAYRPVPDRAATATRATAGSRT